ncbi:MAG: S8 family serine peptidase [Candidatus Omnitrophota bacterium]|nr:S8 family serine peptidase [Candidatus Omnitrophota bacterium]
MIKRSLLTLAVCLLVPVSGWAADAPAPSSTDYFPGQVLVRVEEGVLLPQVQEIAGAVGAKVERRVASWGVYLLKFEPTRPVSEVVERLQAQPGVRYAEPNAKLQLHSIGGDLGTITAAAASGIVVAVIDTGVDRTHPSLSNLIYTNPKEIAGDGIDNDANGYKDDVHGWDFYNKDNDASGGPGDDAHGTKVAGRVVQGSGGQGISILPLQIGSGGDLSLSAIIEAIDYAVAQGARVINMSFGTESILQTLTEAIQHAAQQGVLLVASAGNSGLMTPNYPAAYPGVVSVAASNNAGRKTWWSSYGGTVDFTAPGENVTTTNWGGGTASVSGTSFSAPFVAGVLARILAALPALTPGEAVQRLQGFVKDVYSLNYSFYRGMLGAGFVDTQVAQQVAEAFPLDNSSTQPPQQEDPGLKARLESELAVARQEVARLQAQLPIAEQALVVAQQATADVQKSLKQADEKFNQAWKELIESWQAWYKGFFGTPSERETLRRRREAAWDKLYKAMAERRDAQARLGVAQAEENRARDRRNTLAAQLNAARTKVSQLEQRLSQLAIPAQGRLQGSAHQSEIEQLLQKLHAVTGSLGRSGLPEGVREVPDLYLSDDGRQGTSSN